MFNTSIMVHLRPLIPRIQSQIFVNTPAFDVSGIRENAFHPTSMAGPTQPIRAGNFSFLGCWTDEKGDRTLSPAGSTGAIDVDTCALFCDAYQYMGTEYSDECKLVIFYSKPATRQLGSDCSRTAADLFSQRLLWKLAERTSQSRSTHGLQYDLLLQCNSILRWKQPSFSIHAVCRE